MQLEFERTLLEVKIEIQEQTLEKVSQEIHDNIGQILVLAKLNLYSIQNFEDKKINDTRNLISKAIGDLRDLSHSMKGRRIAEIGFAQAVAEELTIVKDTGQFQIDLQVPSTNLRLPLEKELILFRIFQEAINNIIKHSKADSINVSVDHNNGNLYLKIVDNGVGFNTTMSKTGIGLGNMKSRILAIDGTIEIESIQNVGTTIHLEVPLRETASKK